MIRIESGKTESNQGKKRESNKIGNGESNQVRHGESNQVRNGKSNQVGNRESNPVGNSESNQVRNVDSNQFGNSSQSVTANADDGVTVGYLMQQWAGSSCSGGVLAVIVRSVEFRDSRCSYRRSIYLVRDWEGYHVKGSVQGSLVGVVSTGVLASEGVWYVCSRR